MPLNKQTGNMFDFITHTWNPIKGACQHDCIYCYMKRWGEGRLKAPRFVKSELKTDLKENNIIFISSSIDIFAPDIPADWIIQILCKTEIHDKNKYLLQTKNPVRYFDFFPNKSTIGYADINADNFILSTTIETDRFMPEIMRNSPPPVERAQAMAKLPKEYKRMVTIEPIITFNLPRLVSFITMFNPEQINIGADTMNKKLPEPSKMEILKLAETLGAMSKKVYLKSNLKRILEA